MKAILTIGQGMYKFTKEMEVPDNDAPTKIYVPFLYAQETEITHKNSEIIEAGMESETKLDTKIINLNVVKIIFILDEIETLQSGEKIAQYSLPSGTLKTTGKILEM